jgi:hypothetical protein
MNFKHHTLHHALLWHGNSITTKRRWMFDQSSGEFSIFLFAKLYIWKFLYNLTATIFHHSPWPWITIHDLPSSINLIAKKKQEHTLTTQVRWVIHFLLARLFSQKFLPLMPHLSPLLLAMNYSLPQHQWWLCVGINLFLSTMKLFLSPSWLTRI